MEKHSLVEDIYPSLVHDGPNYHPGPPRSNRHTSQGEEIMEKRAVIDEEITPAEEKEICKNEKRGDYDKLPPYQQKIADILGSTPIKLENLDENHPTRRLMAGLGKLRK